MGYAAEYLTRADSSFLSLIALGTYYTIFHAAADALMPTFLLRLAPPAKEPISCEHCDEKSRKR